MSLFDLPSTAPAPKRAKTSLADLPAHVKAKLETAGAVDFGGKGPPAVAKAMRIECPGCGATVIRGLLPMPTPWAVDVDTRPLSRYSEVLVLLDGGHTYNLSWRYDRLELASRGNWDFHLPESARVRQDIVARHQCGHPPRWPVEPTRLPPLRLFTRSEPTPDGAAPY